jgi:hypothetical protein
MKIIASAVCIAALFTVCLACGQDESASGSLRLDQVVPRLPGGSSVEQVEEQLGHPRGSAELEDGEVVVYYGLWQLAFDPGLIGRTRYYKAGYWPPGRPFGSLDHQVHALPLGSSRALVEHKLGRTEAWQVLKFRTRERIWYGNGRWKLYLRSNKLSGKELTDQVSAPSSP